MGRKIKAKSTLSGLLAASLVAFIVLAGPVSAQVTVEVPTSFDLPEAPNCPFPCENDVSLPLFMKELHITGPEGFLRTELSPKLFRQRLEGWRRHAEIYRRSAERTLVRSGKTHEAKVKYLLKLAYYDQVIGGYRNALAIQRGGNVMFTGQES